MMSARCILGAFARTRAVLLHDLLPPDVGDRYDIAVLDDIAQFHYGDAGLDGRFPWRYNELCQDLASLLARVDAELAGRTYLEPIWTDVRGRLTQQFKAKFMPIAGIAYPAALTLVMDCGVHLLWWQLREFHRKLEVNREPVFQTVTIENLPVELVDYVLGFLDNGSLRSANATCRLFHSVRLGIRDRTFRYTFAAHKPVLVDTTGYDLPPFVGDVYGRQLCELAVRMHKANSTAFTLASVRHLSLRDHWCYSRMMIPMGSTRLTSPDFLQLGHAAEWVLSRFPSLRRASFSFMYISNELLSALGCSPVDHLSLRYCAALDPTIHDVSPAPTPLTRVHTVDFKIDQLALREKHAFWHLLEVLPMLRIVHVASSGPFHALNLIVPAYIRLPDVQLKELHTLVLVGVDQSTAPALLTWFATAAPRLRHLYISRAYAARRSLATSTVSTDELLQSISPWRNTLHTLNAETLDDISADSLERLHKCVPGIRSLSWSTRTGVAGTVLAECLGCFAALELFRSNSPADFEVSTTWKILKACPNLIRMALAGPSYSEDEKRWSIWRGEMGVSIETILVESPRRRRTFASEDAIWACAACPRYD